MVNLADVAAHSGRFEDAVTQAEGALRIWSDKLGPDHAYCAYAHIVIAEGLMGLGRYEDALAAFERGLEIRLAGDETEQQLAEPLTGRGAALLALGRPGQALEALERAWAIRERHPTEELHAPDTAFTLARALWATGEDAKRDRALELGRRAVKQYAAVGASRAESLAAAKAWVEAHAGDD